MTSRKKILLVDDEQINLDFFDLMLTRFGFMVCRSVNGKDGLEQVKKQNPDLILLDNIMPVMTGWDFIRMLKTSPEYAQWQHIPVIMFSALSDSQNKIQGYNMGIEDYIVKPFNFGEVLARINSVLKTHELGRELSEVQKKLEDEKKRRLLCEKTIEEIMQILHRAAASMQKEDSGKYIFDLCSNKISGLHGCCGNESSNEENASAVKEEFSKNELDNSFESLSKI